jgi:hypothetical protein
MFLLCQVWELALSLVTARLHTAYLVTYIIKREKRYLILSDDKQRWQNVLYILLTMPLGSRCESLPLLAGLIA